MSGARGSARPAVSGARHETGRAPRIGRGSGNSGGRHSRGTRRGLFWTGLLAALLLAGCGGGGGGGGSGSSGGGGGGTATITSISIDPDTAQIARGGDTELQVIAHLSNGDSEPISDESDVEIFWQSLDEEIAEVTGSGATAVVRGKRIGNAMVKAFLNEHDASANVAVSALQVRPTFTRLPLDCTEQLTARLVSSDGVTRDVSTDAVWETSDEAIAVVADDGQITATAVAEDAGTVVARASYQGAQATGVVTVEELTSLTGIAIDPAGPIELAIKEPRRLKVNGTFDGEDGRDLSNCVAWSSDPGEGLDPGDVVTVSDDGVIEAVATGTTTVTATYRGVSDDIEVTVTKNRVTGLSVENPTDPSGLPQYDTVGLTARAIIEEGAVEANDVTDAVDWSSDAPDVASVSNDPETAGVVRGLDPDPDRNPVTITAALSDTCDSPDSLCDTASITVTHAVDEATDLTASAEPNVVLAGADPADTSVICARLIPADVTLSFTRIQFTVLPEDGGSIESPDDPSAEDGEACATLIPGISPGIVTVHAQEVGSDPADDVTVQVVNSFASVFAISGDEVVTDKEFEATLVNGSNREFPFEANDVTFCNGTKEIEISSLGIPESNLIVGGAKIELSVTLTSEHDDHGFAIVVDLNDPDVPGSDFKLIHQFTDPSGPVDCTA